VTDDVTSASKVKVMTSIYLRPIISITAGDVDVRMSHGLSIDPKIDDLG